jgi:hypothetical protein
MVGSELRVTEAFNLINCKASVNGCKHLGAFPYGYGCMHISQRLLDKNVHLMTLKYECRCNELR